MQWKDNKIDCSHQDLVSKNSLLMKKVQTIPFIVQERILAQVSLKMNIQLKVI